MASKAHETDIQASIFTYWEELGLLKLLALQRINLSPAQQFTRISNLTPAMLGTCFPSTRRNAKEPSKGEITWTVQSEIKPTICIIFPLSSGLLKALRNKLLFKQMSERKHVTCMKTDSINRAYSSSSQTHWLCHPETRTTDCSAFAAVERGES